MKSKEPMNVIVVITDSLRADHLGCYGNPWIRTPNIDRFAADATLFEQAYSEGLPTGPTRHAFWTGRYTFPFMGWKPFEPSERTLAEFLWDKGFTTALITDVYHLHKPGTNWGRGFDTVRFIRGQEYDPFVVDPTIPVDLDAHHKLRGDESDASRSAEIPPAGTGGRATRTTSLHRRSRRGSNGWSGSAAGIGASFGWTASTRTSRGIRRSRTTGCMARTTRERIS